MALTEDGKLLLVANFGSGTLSLVDTGKSRQLEQISVCEGPVDVAVARQGRSNLAYLSCYKSGTVDIVDLLQRRPVQRLSVGAKPFGILAHPNQKRVYVCVGGTNELVVIEVGQPSRIVRRIKIDGNPLQIAVSR
jgi:YVTN family beta-propeller protein